MNKDLILKIAKTKNLQDFYKKFPSQEVFMKAHGKEFKKAQMGISMQGVDSGLGTYNKISRPPINQEMDANIPSHINNPNFGAKQQKQYDAYKSNQQLQVIGDEETSYDDSSNNTEKMLNQGLGIATDLASGFSQLKGEKQKLKKARQWEGVTDIQKQAAATRPEQSERKYARPEDRTTTGEELFPIYGTGTNVLAKNGTSISNNDDDYEEILDVYYEGGEIQNTYAPNNLYNDLGYEPLGESIPKAQNGFSSFITGQGGDKLSSMAGNIMGNDAGSNIGGTVGKTAGTLLGGPLGGAIGEIGGKLIGGALDRNDNKIKKAEDATNRNMASIASGEFGRGLQNQNNSFLKNGGYVNLDDTDTFRSGGNLRRNNQYALGGELQTHWGGGHETLSYNKHLPDGGETIMFRGQSHEESDNKGNTGIGITYGDNPVEVERGEPAVKLKNGSTGEDNLIVYGNLQIPKYGEAMLNDPKASGKKFKNYVADLSKTETSQNKLAEKTTNEVNDLKVVDSFDKLKLTSLNANLQGANMKLKSIADKKIKAATLQNAINETAQEQGLIADDLAKGNIVKDKKAMKTNAKFGGEFEKAQDGTTKSRSNYEKMIEASAQKYGVDAGHIKNIVNLESGFNPSATSNMGAQGIMQFNPSTAKQYGVDKILKSTKPEDIQKVIDAGVKHFGKLLKDNNNDYSLASAAYNGGQGSVNYVKKQLDNKNITGEDWINFMEKRNKTNPTSKKHAWQKETLDYVKHLQTPDKVESIAPEFRKAYYDPDSPVVSEEVKQAELYTPKDSSSVTPIPSIATNPIQATEEKSKFNGLNTINSLIPYLRPSDAESLDPRQLSGEMNALSSNQLEPVKAQQYNPQLDVPYDISLQEIRNENQADYNAAQRMSGYNPAALAVLNAQKYAANQKVGAEEFRLNQAKKDQVYSGNRATLNDAQLKNLGILDQQYVRQEQAKSNTKDTTQLALNSIASKYAQNSLENKTLQTYENQYNYRYDDQGRLINMNPLANYNIPTVGKTASDPTDEYTKSKAFIKAYEDEQKKTIKSQTTPKRNGAIVNAMKRL
jgi:soluble lytic murein transglycosylase-like protein